MVSLAEQLWPLHSLSSTQQIFPEPTWQLMLENLPCRQNWKSKAVSYPCAAVSQWLTWHRGHKGADITCTGTSNAGGPFPNRPVEGPFSGCVIQRSQGLDGTPSSVLRLSLKIGLGESFHTTPSSSRTQVSCPWIQLNSDVVYWVIAPDSTGWRLGPTRLLPCPPHFSFPLRTLAVVCIPTNWLQIGSSNDPPPPRDAKLKSRLFPILMTDWL